MREHLEAGEAIRPTSPEELKLLTQEQIDAISISSVEKEKARTSDDQLWSKMLDTYNEEVNIKANIAYYCKKAQTSEGGEYEYWQSTWMGLCSKLKFTDDYIRLVAWHLTMRGQASEVAKFLNERAQYENENRMEWLVARDKTPTLHLVRD